MKLRLVSNMKLRIVSNNSYRRQTTLHTPPCYKLCGRIKTWQLTSGHFRMGNFSLWGYWNALTGILSTQPHTPTGSCQVPLGCLLLLLAVLKHFLSRAFLSAVDTLVFFLFSSLRCCTGPFRLAAPAFSKCVTPAAVRKSRISRAHCTKPAKEQ